MNQSNNLSNDALPWLAEEIVSLAAQYRDSNSMSDTEHVSAIPSEDREEIKIIMDSILPQEEPAAAEKSCDIQKRLFTIFAENHHLKNSLPHETLRHECTSIFREPATPETVFSFSSPYYSSLIEGQTILQVMPLLLHLQVMPPKTLRLYAAQNTWETIKTICKNHIVEVAQAIQSIPNTYYEVLPSASVIYADCMRVGYGLLTRYLQNMTNKSDKIAYLREAANAHDGVLLDNVRSAALRIGEMTLSPLAASSTDEMESLSMTQEVGR